MDHGHGKSAPIPEPGVAPLGIDDLETNDREGRPFNLLPDGRILTELF